MLQYLHTIKSKAQEKTLFIPFTNVTFRKHQRILALMLIWVGFLGVCLEVVGGWGCLKNSCFNANLGGLFRGLFRGCWRVGLSKTRKNYARNFKFGA